MRRIQALALGALLCACASGGPSEPVEAAKRTCAEGACPEDVEAKRDLSDRVCEGGGHMRGGSVSVALPAYPCEVARTDEVLEELEGRKGFLAGSARFFLRVRLFTRGVFSAWAGLIGLG